MSRTYLAAVLCLALTTLLGCSSPGTPAVWDPCAAPNAEPFARLVTSGGIAGVNETLAVRCDGTVERNGEVVASDVTLIAPLLSRLRESGVLELPDDSFEPDAQCNDCFLYELELAGGATARRWSAVETALPEQLGAAINALRSVDATQ